MKRITLTLTTMANGGAAMGRDENGRSTFVPFAIPGETVKVGLQHEKRGYARAQLLEVLAASPARVAARCPHFTVCGGCHFQHIDYPAQLEAKQAVVSDQLQRIGGIKQALVRPTIPHPAPWHYRHDISLSPTPDGGLGFWSPSLKAVMPIEVCHIIHPRLMALWQDVDLDLPGLRRLTLRLGDDEALLAALEVEGVEPPVLEADFPVSVALVLPDQTAVSLVGDFYLVRTVRERPFRVSPGCYFQPSPAAAELLVDTVLTYAQLSGQERVLDAYSGVGMLTAFLAEKAAAVTAVESNGDAVADTAVNLHHTDNVSLYHGLVEDIVPQLSHPFDLAVVHPPAKGLTPQAIQALANQPINKLIYISSDAATLARDGKQLQQSGYRLVEVQPIDMAPQTFHVDSVSLWES